MSHIHFPDGILPTWLWVSGFVIAILVWVVFFRLIQREDLGKRLPLLGMMAAAMVLGAAVEILPIAYHVNLTVISGMLLGPSLVYLATFVVNVLLALFGHGGITVIGLNTLVLSLEGILGYYLFRLFRRVLKRLVVASFLATFLALLVSTCAMIGIVSLGTTHYRELLDHGDENGIVGFELGKDKGHDKEAVRPKKEVNFGRFIAVVLPLGFIGWILEGIITSLMMRYIYRLRPDLLGMGSQEA